MGPLIHWDLHKRKRTGGKQHPYRKKRAYEIGGAPTETKIGEPIIKVERVRGGNKKIRVLQINFANVIDPKTGKASKAEILKLVMTPDKALFRKGVITKGSILETSIGKVLVTSRPGRDGTVNAVLLESETTSRNT